MEKNLTVYHKMTASTQQLIKVVDEEIGVKCCQPFAVRAFDALNELQLKTEADAKKAANIFLDNLQTLIQGGVTSEDYDKIDLIKRGNVITISARIQALLRAFRRKGFMVVETIVAVPQGDDVYFEETYKDNVGIVYLIKDSRINSDREILPERLIDGYFSKFICRLEICNLKTNKTIYTVTELSNKEVMNAQSASDNGLFISEWKPVIDNNGKAIIINGRQKKQKVIYDGKDGRPLKINYESIWYKWCSEMVKKTVIRRALKNIKETIPELEPTIMAFDTAEYNEGLAEEPVIETVDIQGVKNLDVNLKKLTDEQKKDVDDCFEIYKQNPTMAMQDAEMIKELYENGNSINEIINEFYAELVNLAKSKNTYPLIENIVKGVPYEKS